MGAAMQLDRYRLVNYFLSFLLAVSPLVIDTATRTFWPLYVALIALVWVIIYDQLLADRQRVELRRHVLNDISKVIANSQSIIKFSHAPEARKYIIQNCSLAKAIFNTRLQSAKFDRENPAQTALKKAQDEAIRNAVRHNALDYHLLYDASHRPFVDDLINWHTLRVRGPEAGQIFTDEVNADDHPFVQFTIMDYGDHSEVLIGWLVPSDDTVAQEIFLIRSNAIADYFKRIYSAYKTINRSG
jgi:hypothetical protein